MKHFGVLMDIKALISLASEKGRFSGLVDEGKYLLQSLLYKQILPRPVRRSFSEGGTPSRLKTICVNPVNLVKKTSCLSAFVAINPFNKRNPRLINDLRLRKLTYEKINLFLQNEPNFRKSQVNVSVLLTGEYVQMDTWSIRKNEPKTNPNEPKTNPILANKTTIRTQFKPNLSRRSLWRSRKQTQFQSQKYAERKC
jgi:hypothetical protein